MIVKGCVIFERTLLSRKKSHNLAWSCAISNIFYSAEKASSLCFKEQVLIYTSKKFPMEFELPMEERLTEIAFICYWYESAVFLNNVTVALFFFTGLFHPTWLRLRYTYSYVFRVGIGKNDDLAFIHFQGFLSKSRSCAASDNRCGLEHTYYMKNPRDQLFRSQNKFQM